MRMQTEMELRMFKQNEYVYHSMREAALKNQPMRMMAEPATDSIKNLFRRKWPNRTVSIRCDELTRSGQRYTHRHVYCMHLADAFIKTEEQKQQHSEFMQLDI